MHVCLVSSVSCAPSAADELTIMCRAVYCFVLSKQTVAVGTEEVAAAEGTAVEVEVVGTAAAAVAAGTEAAATRRRQSTLAPGPASKKQTTGLCIACRLLCIENRDI